MSHLTTSTGIAGEDAGITNQIHAAQPGFLGSVTVDLGEERQFVLNLWDTEEHRVSR